MSKKTASNTPIEYINNPFFIGAKGINLVFLKAQSVAILLVVLSIVYFFGSSALPQPGTEEVQLTVELAMIIAATFIAFTLVGTFVSGVMSYTAAKVANDETTSIKETLQAVIERYWSLLWLHVLMGVKILGWTLLFIVPGVIKLVRYSLAPVAFFDKGLKGNAAIQHSVDLTKGSWITTLGGQTLLSVITFGIIDFLVGAASSAILYRQFSQIPANERPQAHWLSIVAMTLVIMAIIFGISLAILLAFAGANYMNGPVDGPAGI